MPAAISSRSSGHVSTPTTSATRAAERPPPGQRPHGREAHRPSSPSRPAASSSTRGSLERRLHALPLRRERHDLHVHPPEQRPDARETTTAAAAGTASPTRPGSSDDQQVRAGQLIALRRRLRRRERDRARTSTSSAPERRPGRLAVQVPPRAPASTSTRGRAAAASTTLSLRVYGAGRRTTSRPTRSGSGPSHQVRLSSDAGRASPLGSLTLSVPPERRPPDHRTSGRPDADQLGGASSDGERVSSGRTRSRRRSLAAQRRRRGVLTAASPARARRLGLSAERGAQASGRRASGSSRVADRADDRDAASRPAATTVRDVRRVDAADREPGDASRGRRRSGRARARPRAGPPSSAWRRRARRRRSRPAARVELARRVRREADGKAEAADGLRPAGRPGPTWTKSAPTRTARSGRSLTTSGTPRRRVTSRASSSAVEQLPVGQALLPQLHEVDAAADGRLEEVGQVGPGAGDEVEPRLQPPATGRATTRRVAILEPHLLVARPLDRLAVSLDERVAARRARGARAAAATVSPARARCSRPLTLTIAVTAA